MYCKTLICVIGKYNHYNILAAMNLKPQVVVLATLEENKENCENARACIASRLRGVEFFEYTLKDQVYEELSNVVNRFDSENTFINLSGGSKLFSLFALQAAQKTNITPIYVDNDKERILKIKEDVKVLQPLDIELTVEDIVCSTGAEIIKHSTALFDKKENRFVVDYIVKHYDMWTYVKDILRNTRIVKQFEFQPLYIEIMSGRLSFMQTKALERFLKMMAEQKLVRDIKFYYDFVEFSFTSREAKSFIMTAGSWLEALTYYCVKEIKEVTNAISGMLFVWDEEIRVHNELDVVAAVDSHLVCISCKDTWKYDVGDLNELEVYGEHLGGRKVKMVLVSTQLPERGEMTMQRAEEMGIDIIVFDGDLKKFKDRLHSSLT